MDKDQEAAIIYVRETDYISDLNRNLAGNAFLAGAAYGRKSEREETLEHLQDYRKAYAEDLFTPIGKEDAQVTSESPSLEAIERLMTRTSAQMGRFILDNLINEIS